jgi:O-antigen ligase
MKDVHELKRTKHTRSGLSLAQGSLTQPVSVSRRPSRPVYLTKAARNIISQGNLPFVVRWSFLLFVGSIGCEVSSITALLGILFFAVYFVYHNPVFSRKSFPPVSREMIWFGIYVAIYALNGFFLPDDRLREFFIRLFTLIQLIIFLWIASDIMKDEKMARKVLISYCIGTLILAFGVVLSIPGFAVTAEQGAERMSIEAVNANLLAYVTALAVVALLGLWLSLSRKRVVGSAWMFGCMFILSLATVYTGSRGGVVMLMVGLSVYLVPYWKNRWRVSGIMIALIGMAGLAYIAVNTPAFYDRWRDYSEEGNTSGRDQILEEALEMISERPVVGWQPIEFRYELGSRIFGARFERDAHNTFLHLFMEVGMVGAVPFLIGLWLCGKGAWKARNRNLALLPLALFVASLVGGMSSTSIYAKAQWFVLAISVAAAAEEKRRGMVLMGRRIENGIQTSSRKLNSSKLG